MDTLFSDAVAQVLRAECTPDVVRAVEATSTPQSAAAVARLWRCIQEAGFADALLPEAQEGAGLSLSQVHPVWVLCGAYGLPAPLAETMVVRAALASAGVASPTGPMALAAGVLQADGTWVCASVRCGQVAEHVLVSNGVVASLLPVASATVSPSGFVLDAAMVWSAAATKAASPSPFSSASPLLAQALGDVQTWQACIYAALIAGALKTVFQRSLQYANDRQQFGRPIGKFQAIQHQLSVMAEQVFAADMAAQLGCVGSADNRPERLRAAVAKARTSEASLEVAALSHSVHGAIGFTAEFDLQLFTRRLHVWRQAGGTESFWHDVLGAALLDEVPGTLALDMLRRTTDTAATAMTGDF